MEDGWIEWAGGECPIEPGEVHSRTFRDGSVLADYVGERTDIMRRAVWSHDGGPLDIVAYKVTAA